jgi:hypothetical protein
MVSELIRGLTKLAPSVLAVESRYMCVRHDMYRSLDWYSYHSINKFEVYIVITNVIMSTLRKYPNSKKGQLLNL